MMLVTLFGATKVIIALAMFLWWALKTKDTEA